jgi:hypothetical protein
MGVIDSNKPVLMEGRANVVDEIADPHLQMQVLRADTDIQLCAH